MPYKEKPITKLYWSIGELAKRYNCATSLLHYYEDEFEIVVKRRKCNTRIYNKKNVILLDEIVYLTKVLKMKLAGARQWLAGGLPVPRLPINVLLKNSI